MKPIPTLCYLLCVSVRSGLSFLYPAFPTSRTSAVSKRKVVPNPNSPFESLSSQSSCPATLSSWQSHVSTHPDADTALHKLLSNLPQSDTPDVAFLFVAQYHALQFAKLVQTASQILKCRLVSIVGGGVIGENIELDEISKPSISILVGYAVNSKDCLTIFHFNELLNPPPPTHDLEFWDQLLVRGTVHQDNKATPFTSCILFADPWSPVESVLSAMGRQSVVVAGGISVPSGTGPTVAIDDKPLPQGSLVGVGLHHPLQLQVIVAQGCRPIGIPYTITSAEGNCLFELDDKSALSVLEEVVNGMNDTKEQNMVSAGLVCGIQAEHDHDDYLIRQIVGYVPSKGGIAIAGGVHTGDRMQFHLRDKNTAEEDMARMMKRARMEQAIFGDKTSGHPVCAMQISCIARGRSLFGVPNVDLSQSKNMLGNTVAIAGWYANGEIGPVGLAGFSSSTIKGSGTYIHGFTTVVAIVSDMSLVVDDPRSISSLTSNSKDVWE